MLAMSSQEKPQTDCRSGRGKEEFIELSPLLNLYLPQRFDLLEKTGVTFGFVTSVIGPNGRA